MATIQSSNLSWLPPNLSVPSCHRPRLPIHHRRPVQCLPWPSSRRTRRLLISLRSIPRNHRPPTPHRHRLVRCLRCIPSPPSTRCSQLYCKPRLLHKVASPLCLPISSRRVTRHRPPTRQRHLPMQCLRSVQSLRSIRGSRFRLHSNPSRLPQMASLSWLPLSSRSIARHRLRPTHHRRLVRCIPRILTPTKMGRSKLSIRRSRHTVWRLVNSRNIHPTIQIGRAHV